jgi:hypothetical protein
MAQAGGFGQHADQRANQYANKAKENIVRLKGDREAGDEVIC